jgi:hypothetical protein
MTTDHLTARLRDGQELSDGQRQQLNERIARVLDPENRRGWFRRSCSVCQAPLPEQATPCYGDKPYMDYIGPDFLSPTDGEAQRMMREWLESRNCSMKRYPGWTIISTQQNLPNNFNWTNIAKHHCHSTALALAVLRVGG